MSGNRQEASGREQGAKWRRVVMAVDTTQIFLRATSTVQHHPLTGKKETALGYISTNAVRLARDPLPLMQVECSCKLTRGA